MEGLLLQLSAEGISQVAELVDTKSPFNEAVLE